MIAAEQATLTLAEVAQRLGISQKTARQKVKRGELPGSLVNGPHGMEYRVPAAALENQPAPPCPEEGQGTVAGGHETAGQATLNPESPPLKNGTLEATLETEAQPRWAGYPTHHPLRGYPDREREHLLQEVAFLRAQLEARTAAEGELRRLLLCSQQALQIALERPMLPAASVAAEKPARVRWWRRWWG